MIGQRIESQRGFPVGPTLLFIFAGGCLIAAVVFLNPHLAVFAVLPAIVGAAWLLVRERKFVAEITADGLEIEAPPLSLAFADIESVRIAGKATQARVPIHVYHTDGVVHIPSRLNVHSGDLYQFLNEKLPVTGSRDLPPVLAKFCADHKGRYGADRVYTFRALQHQHTYRIKVGMSIFAAIALAGLCWLVSGLLLVIVLHDKNGGVWVIASLFAIFLGSIITVQMWFLMKGSRIRKWRKSGLVISPGGLAMSQGDMTGQLRWDEVRGIRFISRNTLGLIHLDVQGATIVIINVYDRPTAEIHERLRAYWEGDGRYA